MTAETPFGNHVRQRRREMDLTQEELARRASNENAAAPRECSPAPLAHLHCTACSAVQVPPATVRAATPSAAGT